MKYHILWLLVLLPSIGAAAQTAQHGVTLSCTGIAGATFNIYRATTSKGEVKPPLASGLPSCAFTDTTVVSGTTYFYTATQVVGGIESAPSNEITAQISIPSAPTNLTGVVF